MNSRKIASGSGAKNALHGMLRDTYELERDQLHKWAARMPEKAGISKAKINTKDFVREMKEKAALMLGKENGELAVNGYDLLLENYLGIIEYQAKKKCGYVIETAFGKEPALNANSRPLTRKAINFIVAVAEERITEMVETYERELLISREKLTKASTADDFSKIFTPDQARRIMEKVHLVL